MDDILDEPKRDPRWKNVKAYVKSYPEDYEDKDLHGLTVFVIELYAEDHLFTYKQSLVTQALKDFPELYGFTLDAMVVSMDMHIRGEAASNDENV